MYFIQGCKNKEYFYTTINNISYNSYLPTNQYNQEFLSCQNESELNLVQWNNNGCIVEEEVYVRF